MTDITHSAAVHDLIGELRMILVPTDADDEAYAQARRAAAGLAAGTDTTVVLYDRSDERWTDTPHPEGPLTRDEVDATSRPHLVAQMDELAASGVEVRAWCSTVPALTRILAAVQALDADAVLVPEQLDHPTMMDRLQPGDAGEMVTRVLDQNVADRVRVLVLSQDGSLDVVPSVDHTDRTSAAPSESRPRQKGNQS
jgi:hypothetical protein